MKHSLLSLALYLCAALSSHAGTIATTNYVQNALDNYDARVLALIRNNVQTNYIATWSNVSSSVSIPSDVSVSNDVATVLFRDTNGIAVVTRHFSITTSTVYAEMTGFRVISSSIGLIPKGMKFAGIGAPSRFVNREIPFQLSYTQQCHSNCWAQSLAATNGNVIYQANMTDACELDLCALEKDGTNYTFRGRAMLRPCRITASEFSDIAGVSTSSALALTNCHWVLSSTTNTPSRIVMTSRQLEVDTPLLRGTSASGSSSDFSLNLNYRASMTAQEWPDPDDDHYWSPNLTPSQEEWYDPNNWISFPVDVPYETVFRGKSYTAYKTCNSIWELNELGFQIEIAPFPYPVLRKYDKHEACQQGYHTWMSCKCKVCGKERDHAFPGDCKPCENQNTTVTKSGRVWVEITCGICGETSDNPNDHSGYHDEGKCVCECGKISLEHEFGETLAEGSQWEDAGEDHKGAVVCDRCKEARKYIHKSHDYGDDTNAEHTYTDYNDEYHLVKGGMICTAIGCGHKTREGGDDTLEPHEFDPANHCKCKCGRQSHQGLFVNACGVEQCNVCGDFVNPELVEHIFGSPRDSLGSSAHSCLCGYKINGSYAYTEAHTWGPKEYTWDGYWQSCEVCGYQLFNFSDNGEHVWPSGKCGLWPCIANHTYYCSSMDNPSERLMCNLPHEHDHWEDVPTNSVPAYLDDNWHVWSMECNYINSDENVPTPHTVNTLKAKHKWHAVENSIWAWEYDKHYFSKKCDICNTTTNDYSFGATHEYQKEWIHSGSECILNVKCLTYGCGLDAVGKVDASPYRSTDHKCRHCGVLAEVDNAIHEWDLENEEGGTIAHIAHCSKCSRTKIVYRLSGQGQIINETDKSYVCPHCNPTHTTGCQCMPFLPAALCPFCMGDTVWTSKVLNVEIRTRFELNDINVYEVTTWECIGYVGNTVVGSYTYTTERCLGNSLD